MGIDEESWLAMWNGPDLDAIRAMSADDLEVTAVTAAIVAVVVLIAGS